MSLKAIYSPNYLKYDFGPGHPFWPQRAEKFIQLLSNSVIKHEIIEPKRATDEDILLVHTKDYLNKVKILAQENGALSVDTPVNQDILKTAYYSVGGSILALNLALNGERTMNLLGGLHHAGISDSSGFCVFNDHAIAIRKLQKDNKIKKAMIYDLDVHAGNGTQEIFYSDPTVFKISIHQDPTFFYPGTGFSWQRGEEKGKSYNLNIPLPAGTEEKEYLATLEKVLPLAQKYLPDVVILILGVDTYREDPLASFNLEIGTYQKIGERFKKFSKIALLCAGGYSQETPNLWLSFLKGFL